MPPNDLVRLLKRILPWIPSINDGIRGEIQQLIDQLQTQMRQ
jgi:hypothetical protein